MHDEKSAELPPGQQEISHFPRFGLGAFAKRFPAEPHRISVTVGGATATEIVLGEALAELTRRTMTADFHCVTTWTVRGLRWSGWHFRDVFERIIVPRARPEADARLVVFRAADGYCSALPLDDLCADDVLLADRLNEEPLGIEHGAPLRLVAPAHYGYKNCKHLSAIEFHRDARRYRFPRPYPRFMDHPRARVALEERGRWLPAAVLRTVYRLLVPSTIRNFERATRAYHARADKAGQRRQT